MNESFTGFVNWIKWTTKKIWLKITLFTNGHCFYMPTREESLHIQSVLIWNYCMFQKTWNIVHNLNESLLCFFWSFWSCKGQDILWEYSFCVSLESYRFRMTCRWIITFMWQCVNVHYHFQPDFGVSTILRNTFSKDALIEVTVFKHFYITTKHFIFSQLSNQRIQRNHGLHKNMKHHSCFQH